MTDPTHRAWSDVLDLLEHDVATSELLAREPHAPEPVPWTPPPIEGPVPADLLPRARELQRRQALAAAALRDACTATARQRAFTERVTGTAGTALAVSAYVDLTA